ncbi:MAG: bifunctional pyr operon transcriptional regulator/uracil phosphoribosyltransferase PyrR [Burkholderiales bacterium]
MPDAEKLLASLVEQVRAVMTPDTALVGIHTGGAWIAERLHQALGLAGPLGSIDVSFYRDDYGSRGLSQKVRPSEIAFEVADREIVLVDDVLYTGRTIRAAINELFDYGRPGKIRLAALVDRGGRQLPICADFVGATVSVADDETVSLKRAEDGRFSLLVEPKQRSA